MVPWGHSGGTLGSLWGYPGTLALYQGLISPKIGYEQGHQVDINTDWTRTPSWYEHGQIKATTDCWTTMKKLASLRNHACLCSYQLWYEQGHLWIWCSWVSLFCFLVPCLVSLFCVPVQSKCPCSFPLSYNKVFYNQIMNFDRISFYQFNYFGTSRIKRITMS